MIKEIIDAFESITRKKLKYVICIVFMCLVAFPVIDKIFIKSFIIQQKITIAKNYSELVSTTVDNNVSRQLISNVEKDIDNYLQDNKQEYSPVKSIQNNLGKFLSGIIIWIIVLAIMLFSKNYNLKQKATTSIFIVIIGFFSGYLSSIIPILVHPIINYIGYNVLEILLLYSIVPIKKIRRTTAST